MSLMKYIGYHLEHYNPDKYWKYRERVVSVDSNIPKILQLYYLYYIRKSNAFNCSSIAIGIGAGAKFLSRPSLPHGLKGIIIHPHATIGNNVTILHNVTIGQRHNDGHCVIGDNVVIGAGAIILGAIRVGDNAKIGAGAVVVHDVPDNATVVGNPAYIVE